MRSAVRREVSSSTTPLMPQELRSAGISVLLIQAPFAYPKKSSPGATDRSIPARSMPVRREGAAAWEAVLTLFGAAGEHASAGTRARAAQRARTEARNGRRLGVMNWTIGRSGHSRKEETTATLPSHGHTRVSRSDRHSRGWGAGGRGAEVRPVAPPGQGLRLGEVLRCKVGLEAWVQRCDFGFRKIVFLAVGRSLAIRYSDGSGAPDPLVDVFDLLPDETPDDGVKRVFRARTKKAFAGRCVMQASRDTKPPSGVKRLTFVPDPAYQKELDAKADPNEVGDPPCGDWGNAR